MGFKRKDHFHKKAKEQGYRSRAVYKLQELQRRFQLVRRGGRVLDIGAAPGGWLQIAEELVGRQGKIVGVDLLPIQPLHQKNIYILEGDIQDEEIKAEALALLKGPPDLVLSDMAPNITGIRITDCTRSFDLACVALEIAVQNLRLRGNFVAKIFPGDDFEEFLRLCKQVFRKVRTTKPEATRKGSSEVYVMGLDFKGPPVSDDDKDDKGDSEGKNEDVTSS